MDPGDEQILGDVETYGWHMITVPADDHGPGFTYTIGLFKSYGHPEIILFGLPNEVMQGVVATAADLVRGGAKFLADTRTSEVLNGYDCVFKAVRPEHYREHLGYAMWYYRRIELDAFPALQCVWPDRAGFFPWDAGFHAANLVLQPALYAPGAVGERAVGGDAG